MSSSDLPVPSSIQNLMSSSYEDASASIGSHLLRSVEDPSSATFEVKNDEIEATLSELSPQNLLSERSSACHTDDLNKKENAKDLGSWLVLDMFVRQERWSQLAKLDASSILIDVKDERRDGSILKRVVDIIVSLFLLVLLMPAIIAITILIRLESNGSALFRHSRVGEGGTEFELWKFRSMRIDTPKYDRSPTSSTDPRLTWIGRVIRRVSLDEIPQLVNVLKGEMSLVGPRPEMAFIVNQYTPIERGRLLVKPGITGLWQISSGRAVPINHNLQYDFYYIQNKNILLDIAILLRTITAVIRGMGAI